MHLVENLVLYAWQVVWEALTVTHFVHRATVQGKLHSLSFIKGQVEACLY